MPFSVHRLVRRWPFAGADDARPSSGPVSSPERMRAVRAAAERLLLDHVLQRWFPAAIVGGGGFHQDFARDWRRLGGAGTSDIVYQARLTWSAAQAAIRYPEHPAGFAAATRHGLRWLAHVHWDRSHGGLHWSVDASGAPVGDWAGEKHLFGAAFAIYAASAGYRALGDPAALAFAQDIFDWLERHAHDPVHGGYREVVAADGAPLHPVGDRRDATGGHYGGKSLNAHLHMLEALAALHDVHPVAAVRARLEEVLAIVLARWPAPGGGLHQHFAADWRPVAGMRSYGHEMETAFLIEEAAGALGRSNDVALRVATRALVDGALVAGADGAGGICHQGPPLDRSKFWWVQVEALNALLLMHEHHAGETDAYWRAFDRLWDFLLRRQLDRRHGGLHRFLDHRNRPRGHVKSGSWTDSYHQTRALTTIMDRLDRLAPPA